MELVVVVEPRPCLLRVCIPKGAKPPGQTDMPAFPLSPSCLLCIGTITLFLINASLFQDFLSVPPGTQNYAC